MLTVSGPDLFLTIAHQGGVAATGGVDNCRHLKPFRKSEGAPLRTASYLTVLGEQPFSDF